MIDTYGSSIRKKGNCFLIKTKESSEEVCADDVTQIIMGSGTHISSDAIFLAAEKNVDIVCLSRTGEPVSRIWPCKFGGTALTRRKQMEAIYNRKGVMVANAMVRAKASNQLYFLQSLNRERGEQTINDICAAIRENIRKASWSADSIDEVRSEIFAFEGGCSRLYFQGLSMIIPIKYGFGGREKRPPADPVNAALSYGYGVLYGKVERACVLSGLDPYLGFLHTDRYGKPSMVLDLIEPFRQPLVDRVVVSLFSRGSFSEEDWTVLEGEGGVYLNESGRRKLLDKLFDRFNKEITYKGKKRRFEDIIFVKIREVARFLLGESKKINAFIYR